ncbi:MAG: type II toxin-antitoxin system VapC family toxin [Nitrospirae bacterium]|nr:type II toxin-antitoxin system VapC family toxin [Nitrospirota bacterium]
MRRLVINTNVYIDWLNAGRHETLIFQPNTVKYLSAVVLMELYAGAASRSDRKRLDHIAQTFRKAGRILLPTSGVYEEAGHVLRRLHTATKPSIAASLGLESTLWRHGPPRKPPRKVAVPFSFPGGC